MQYPQGNRFREMWGNGRGAAEMGSASIAHGAPNARAVPRKGDRRLPPSGGAGKPVRGALRTSALENCPPPPRADHAAAAEYAGLWDAEVFLSPATQETLQRAEKLMREEHREAAGAGKDARSASLLSQRPVRREEPPSPPPEEEFGEEALGGDNSLTESNILWRTESYTQTTVMMSTRKRRGRREEGASPRAPRAAPAARGNATAAGGMRRQTSSVEVSVASDTSPGSMSVLVGDSVLPSTSAIEPGSGSGSAARPPPPATDAVPSHTSGVDARETSPFDLSAFIHANAEIACKYSAGRDILGSTMRLTRGYAAAAAALPAPEPPAGTLEAGATRTADVRADASATPRDAAVLRASGQRYFSQWSAQRRARLQAARARRALDARETAASVRETEERIQRPRLLPLPAQDHSEQSDERAHLEASLDIPDVDGMDAAAERLPVMARGNAAAAEKSSSGAEPHVRFSAAALPPAPRPSRAPLQLPPSLHLAPAGGWEAEDPHIHKNRPPRPPSSRPPMVAATARGVSATCDWSRGHRRPPTIPVTPQLETARRAQARAAAAAAAVAASRARAATSSAARPPPDVHPPTGRRPAWAPRITVPHTPNVLRHEAFSRRPRPKTRDELDWEEMQRGRQALRRMREANERARMRLPRPGAWNETAPEVMRYSEPYAPVARAGRLDGVGGIGRSRSTGTGLSPSAPEHLPGNRFRRGPANAPRSVTVSSGPPPNGLRSGAQRVTPEEALDVDVEEEMKW